MGLTKHHFKLIELLAYLAPDIASAQRYITFAEIQAGTIAFTTAAKNNWTAIIGEAVKQEGKVIRLIDEVLKDYPRQDLRDIRAALLNDEPASKDAETLELLKKLLANPKSRSVLKAKFFPEEVEPAASLSDSDYEKIIGDKNNLRHIAWINKGMKAAESVCRIRLANGKKGTGFLVGDNYLLTNNHVLKNDEIVKEAVAEFNYDEDEDAIVAYRLDPTGALYSPKTQFDYAYVKVIDRNDRPLSEWGSLRIEDSETPLLVGEKVNIIQHPHGEPKQIAFEENEIISLWRSYMFYTTDTDKGSSGSPVLNDKWRVIALHHAGKIEDGGLRINEAGDKEPSNRGVLIGEVFADIKRQKSDS